MRRFPATTTHRPGRFDVRGAWIDEGQRAISAGHPGPYQVTQPYYVQTGGTFAVTQRISGPVDAGARLTVQQLAYRNREGLDALLGDRVDHVLMYGGSVGYHVGPDLRIAFNVDQQTRDSEVDHQHYEGLRMGVSVTYGF